MLRTVKVICGINTVKREQPLLIEMEDLLRSEGIAFSVEELSSKAQAEYAVYRNRTAGCFLCLRGVFTRMRIRPGNLLPCVIYER